MMLMIVMALDGGGHGCGSSGDDKIWHAQEIVTKVMHGW